MTREQYLQKVKDIMIYKNPYGAYHQMTPINSDIINNIK